MNKEEFELRLSEIFTKWEQKPVLFVGSGISRRYKSIPGWKDLIKEISLHTNNNDPMAFIRYSNEYNDEPNGPLPFIAKQISDDYSKKFLAKQIDNDLFDKYEKVIVRDELNVFKIYLSEYINSFTYNSDYEREKESFKQVGKKISNIITTNYDTILEENFPSFTPIIGEMELLNKRFYNFERMYKIHGSVKQTDSIVFTSKDYEKINKKQKYLSAKLLTLFIEFPIIFIGYSINDPDILAILEDIKECLNKEQLEKLAKKILFIEYSQKNPYQIVEFDLKTIPMTRITLYDDYSVLYKCMDKVTNKYEIGVLRQIEDLVTDFVFTQKDDNTKIYCTALTDPALKPTDLAVHIASKNSISYFGYEGLKRHDLCENALFNYKNLDPDRILEKVIPNDKTAFPSTSLVPLYQFIKKSKKDYSNKSIIQEKIIHKLSDIYCSTENESLSYRKKQYNFNNFDDIKNSHFDNIRRYIEALYFNIELIPKDELKSFLIDTWGKSYKNNELINGSKTLFFKLICVYDYLENK